MPLFNPTDPSTFPTVRTHTHPVGARPFSSRAHIVYAVWCVFLGMDVEVTDEKQVLIVRDLLVGGTVPSVEQYDRFEQTCDALTLPNDPKCTDQPLPTLHFSDLFLTKLVRSITPHTPHPRPPAASPRSTNKRWWVVCDVLCF